MTHQLPDRSEKHYGSYCTLALAYEDMIEFCTALVYTDWSALVSELETGVSSQINEPKVVHVIELLPESTRFIPMAQIMIDNYDLVRGDIADPTTREMIDPPRLTTLAARSQRVR